MLYVLRPLSSDVATLTRDDWRVQTFFPSVRVVEERLRSGSIREVVFGVEDGSIQNMALVAGMAGAQMSTQLIAAVAAINAIAGVLSMSMGTYLSSRAERDVTKNGESIESHGRKPRRDAAVMAGAYALGATVPIIPFVAGMGIRSQMLTASLILTLAALFMLGVVKAALSGQRRIRAGVEMAALASAAGIGAFIIGLIGQAVLGGPT